MMRFSEVRGRKVVSTTTADTVGKVSGFLVDPETRGVAGLRLKKTHSGKVVAWADLTAVGEDAVTVHAADRIVDPDGRLAELSSKAHKVLGKRVLAASGDRLGDVEDVEFDPESGLITALVLASDSIAGVRILGIGSYAVVVSTTA